MDIRVSHRTIPRAPNRFPGSIRYNNNNNNSRPPHIPPGSLTPDQRAYLALRTQQISGRLPVDFVTLFQRGDEGQNILLQKIIY